jgi:uncharacterized protein
MKTNSKYIVIDTNVLISAGLLPESKTAQVLILAVSHFVIAQNTETWLELETRIGRKKFDRYFGDTGRQRHLIEIAKYMKHIPQVSDVAVSRDASDDKFVSLAIDAGAKIIISGDPDLKVIKQYEDIEILSPAQFFDRYN